MQIMSFISSNPCQKTISNLNYLERGRGMVGDGIIDHNRARSQNGQRSSSCSNYNSDHSRWAIGLQEDSRSEAYWEWSLSDWLHRCVVHIRVSLHGYVYSKASLSGDWMNYPELRRKTWLPCILDDVWSRTCDMNHLVFNHARVFHLLDRHRQKINSTTSPPLTDVKLRCRNRLSTTCLNLHPNSN